MLGGSPALTLALLAAVAPALLVTNATRPRGCRDRRTRCGNIPAASRRVMCVRLYEVMRAWSTNLTIQHANSVANPQVRKIEKDVRSDHLFLIKLQKLLPV